LCTEEKIGKEEGWRHAALPQEVSAGKSRRFTAGTQKKNVWKGKYHLYLDEAGEYANWKLAEIMSLGRGTGLKVTVAHQYFDQFPDRLLLKGIRNTSNVKVAFHIQDSEDRTEIVKDMYGGALSDREVSYALSKDTPRKAVVKIGSGDAMKFKTEPIEPVPVTSKQMYEGLMESFKQEGWHDVEDILHEFGQS
jgi:hypothetical protein